MAGSPRLTLAPASDRGWFGGEGFVAARPLEVHPRLTLAEAGALLEAAYAGKGPGIVAVLAAYDGTCSAARFTETQPLPLPAGRAATVECSPPPVEPPVPATEPLLADVTWDITGHEFRTGVDAVRERIAAGDVYVLNLTARLSGTPLFNPAATFETLRARAQADMAALLENWPGDLAWLASASPERFLRVTPGEDDARLIEVCPIKGTAPRGCSAMEDGELAEKLAGDEKERAEHVMIVDLERNDLGAACVPGTVRVDPLYEVVQTPYCHQLVSTVRGTMRAGATFAELLTSAFPCGSVTGAPKRAAMRIISELEHSERGAYCGALIVARAGELDSSVLIRTLEGPAESPVATWGTGCGITHESDPAVEWLEALLKASPVLGDSLPPVALRETMRVVDGRVPLLDRHLARLVSGGCGPTVLARVRSEAAGALAAAGAMAAGRLSVTVTPDGGVTAGTSTEPSSLAVADGVRFACVEVATLPQLPPAAAKPAARRFWDLAHRAARGRGADQAVLVDPHGDVVDGSTATVWLVADGVLHTPPAPPAVSGVARELVLDLAHSLGIGAAVRSIAASELDSADEVFFSNAYGGIAPARGRSGPVTERIVDAFERELA